MSNDPYLRKTSARVTPAILEFCKERVNKTFYAEDLRRFVNVRTRCAPASVTRILQDLKQRGLVDYEVVSRSQSLYRVIGLKGEQQ